MQPPVDRELGASPAVLAADVVKTFGATRALDGAGLRIDTGETHGLIGRNGAGKSTLVSILAGLVSPDGGEVAIGGEPAPAAGDPWWRDRVACVYQHPKLFPDLSVAENLFVNDLPRRRAGRVDWRTLNRQAGEVLDAWQIDIPPTMKAGRLAVEQRQLVEIARALRRGSRFIILDEPTARLERHGIEILFDALRRLQPLDVTFLYISHHLTELFEICDGFTVLRDGRTVRAGRIADVSRDDLIEAMVGESRVSPVYEVPRRAPAAEGEAPVAVIERLRGEGFGPVSITVEAGELVGIGGHAGSGLRELAETLVGLRRASDGAFALNGRDMLGMGVHERLEHGLGFVPEDRHYSGFVGQLSVEENLTLTCLGRMTAAGVIRRGERRRLAHEMISALEVRAEAGDALTTLSGGNQQKVVMGRALATRPELLILVHPTAGVDVASKEALFGAVAATVAAGGAAVLFSDEYDELHLCSTVHVLYDGHVAARMPAGWQEDDLVAAMEGSHAG